MSRLLMGVLLVLIASPCAAQTFVRHTEWLKVGPHVTSMVAADLDGDGLPEIVTADRGRLADPREERPAQDQLSYLVGGKDLAYVALPQLRTGFGPYRVVVANVDALKAPDLVVANFHATRNRDLTLLRNLGGNLFEPLHFKVPDEGLRYTKMRDGDGVPIFTTPGLTSLLVEDVNGDGYRDAIATGWCSDILVYFPGTPETYFGEPTLTRVEGGPRDVAAADFDGDGALDLAMTLYSTNEIALWKGDGKGHFTEVERFASRGRLPNRIVIEDMNRDGRPDLVVSHSHADDSIVLFYGSGGFRFGLSQEILLGDERGAVEYEIRDLVVADFNRDGKADIAAACSAAGRVVVLINEAEDQRIPQPFRRENYGYKEAKPRALCVSDFNGDGRPDLGVALWEVNSVALLLGR